MSKDFVSPVGYVELDNDCEYSIDLKSTRSRETVVPKEDLAFYFNTYIEPKYGLGNINVSNCASFMKDLELNWSKLDNNLKNKVLDIMVDYIFNKEGDFKSKFMEKMKTPVVQSSAPAVGSTSKSSFGKTKDNTLLIVMLSILAFCLLIFLLDKFKCKPVYSKMV